MSTQQHAPSALDATQRNKQAHPQPESPAHHQQTPMNLSVVAGITNSPNQPEQSAALSLVSLSGLPPSLPPLGLHTVAVTTTGVDSAHAVTLSAVPPHPPATPPVPAAQSPAEPAQLPVSTVALNQTPQTQHPPPLPPPPPTHQQQQPQFAATGPVQQPLPFPPLTPAQGLQVHTTPAPRLPLPVQVTPWPAIPPGALYMPPTPGWSPSAPYHPIPPGPPPHAAQQMAYTAGDEHLRITPDREARTSFNVHVWIRAVEDALRRRGLLQDSARAALWVTGLLDVATNVYTAVAAKPSDAPELTAWPALKVFLTTFLDRSGSHAQAQRALASWNLFTAGSLTQ